MARPRNAYSLTDAHVDMVVLDEQGPARPAPVKKFKQKRVTWPPPAVDDERGRWLNDINAEHWWQPAVLTQELLENAMQAWQNMPLILPEPRVVSPTLYRALMSFQRAPYRNNHAQIYGLSPAGAAVDYARNLTADTITLPGGRTVTAELLRVELQGSPPSPRRSPRRRGRRQRSRQSLAQRIEHDVQRSNQQAEQPAPTPSTAASEQSSLDTLL